MKQHLETIAACNARIEQAQATVARVTPKEEKHRAAHAAASEKAAELRAEAQRAMALADIGDGGADPQHLLAQAEASEKRAEDLRATLAGLAEIKTTAAADEAAARTERAKANIAAFQEYATRVIIPSWTSAAEAYREQTRLVLAAERIFSSMGVQINLLLSHAIDIPAPAGFTGPRVGAFDDLMYRADHDLRRSSGEGPIFEAANKLLDVLARAGLDL